jgi:hypothetical protein
VITIRTLADVLARAGLTDAVWLHIPPGGGNRLDAYQRCYLRGPAALEAETREQTGRNFQGARHIVMLIPYDQQERYFFAGVYQVTSDERPERVRADGTAYFEVLNELTPLLAEWNGRLVFKWKRPVRYRYLKAETAAAELALVEMREAPFGREDIRFPGFYGFHLDRPGLEGLFANQLPSWRTALSAVAGVYAITDTKTGAIYVGSAYGEQGLWTRWGGYAATQHNGNKLLKAHVAEHGVANLRYSVLLTMDIRSAKEDVVERESFFKQALGTRVHGLNAN